MTLMISHFNTLSIIDLISQNPVHRIFPFAEYIPNTSLTYQ